MFSGINTKIDTIKITRAGLFWIKYLIITSNNVFEQSKNFNQESWMWEDNPNKKVEKEQSKYGSFNV